MTLKHTVTKEQVLALHAEHVAFKSSGALPLAGVRPAGWNARQSTRTEVHALIHLQCPTPTFDASADPDDVHHEQKKHGKALWIETDRLVTEALGSAS